MYTCMCLVSSMYYVLWFSPVKSVVVMFTYCEIIMISIIVMATIGPIIRILLDMQCLTSLHVCSHIEPSPIENLSIIEIMLLPYEFKMCNWVMIRHLNILFIQICNWISFFTQTMQN